MNGSHAVTRVPGPDRRIGVVASASRAADLDALARALERRLPGAVARDQHLADLTTYRLGGPIAVVVRVVDEEGLAVVAEALAAAAVPVLLIGRGSNLLVADRGYAALGVVLGGTFEDVEIDVGAGIARAGSAVPLPVLARRAAACGLGGLEFYVGIPGSVGGAVRMNAGGHGRETRDVLDRAWVLDLRGGATTSVRPRTAVELDLSYRHSNVRSTDVVTRAEFHGTREAPDVCAARIDEIVRWRREHQPGGANAGSVFRNPLGDSAGRLIETAGCKGLTVGGATVSTKHANFIQAAPEATAGDVHQLVHRVRDEVMTRTGVVLEPELHMVGFDDDPDGAGSSEPGGSSA